MASIFSTTCFRFLLSVQLVAIFLIYEVCSDVTKKHNRIGINLEGSALHLSFEPYKEFFENYTMQFDKKYKSDLEWGQRFKQFLINVRDMEEHNLLYKKGKTTFFMAPNKFSDMSHEEYLRFNKLGKYKSSFRKSASLTFSRCGKHVTRPDVPESIDWRQLGAVTPVKNQKECGSCWAFSATGAAEAQHFIKTKTLLNLSEQQILDCCRLPNCDGCQGGLMEDAFVYANISGGLEEESEYPYKGMDWKCRFDQSRVKVRVTGCHDIKHSDESDLQNAVGTVGPVSVAIDAGHRSFQHYGGGVYYEHSCGNREEDLDHGVLAVGYGTDNELDYWIVKNSWATSWGDKGYIYMSRNKNNNCGIATAADYPDTD